MSQQSNDSGSKKSNLSGSKNDSSKNDSSDKSANGPDMLSNMNDQINKVLGNIKNIEDGDAFMMSIDN